MEEKIYFDAANYPEYHRAKDRAKRNRKIGVMIFSFLMALLILFFVVEYFLQESSGMKSFVLTFALTILLITLFVVAFTMLRSPPLLRKSIRISDKGIELPRAILPLSKVDRIVVAKNVITILTTSGIKNLLGDPFIYWRSAFGNADEFVRIVKTLRPRIRVTIIGRRQMLMRSVIALYILSCWTVALLLVMTAFLYPYTLILMIVVLGSIPVPVIWLDHYERKKSI
jgi:hypothetical protein